MRRRSSPFWIKVALLLVVLLSLGRSARADDVFDEHLSRGLRSYNEQRFDDAIKEFEAAYAIDPAPRLLINLGQAYRKVGRPKDALICYQRFLQSSSAPTDEERRRVEEYTRLARQTIDDQERLLHPPPPPPPPLYRRAWFWGALSAVVVSAGVAAALGVTRPWEPHRPDGLRICSFETGMCR